MAAVTQATFKYTAAGWDSAAAEKGNVGKRMEVEEVDLR